MNVILLVIALCGVVYGDIYFHVPRGSNNRLNERSAERSNANRLFDSQKYFASSEVSLTSSIGEGSSYLTIEWTNQHGCGGDEDTDPHKLNCNLVLQYQCQDDAETADRAVTLRNGVATGRQAFSPPQAYETEAQTNSRRDQVQANKGLHESWDSYNECFIRERNQGLFTADQNLRKLGYSSAVVTRQNSGGQRRGYECPEERDYYPYWHPTAWKDIAIMAQNQTMCSYYQSESFNTVSRHQCVEWWDTGKTRRKASRWNTQSECSANGGVWTAFSNYLEKTPEFTTSRSCTGASGNGVVHIWAIPHDSSDGRTEQCLVALPTPKCQAAPWSRVNHLGNGRDGQANNYTWTLPYFPSGHQQRCVLRMRYNISTDDYDPYNTDARFNNEQSPVKNNPLVRIGENVSPLRLAINTAQFGRTFQDRSHIFILRTRPQGVETEKIFNLNVRGKRGNIVQAYPAVEYDFAPSTLDIDSGDLVHIQWAGSNTHDNAPPAGDGQAGDDGEGAPGTDRHNFVQLADLSYNFPLTFAASDMFQGAEIKWIYHGNTNVGMKDLAINLASSGYLMCVKSDACPDPGESGDIKMRMQDVLNNAPASYEGVLLKFPRGLFHYMCTRNNNFTNRSQKGTLIVQ